MKEITQMILGIAFLLLLLLIIMVFFTIIRTYLVNKNRKNIKQYINTHLDEWFDHLYYGYKPPQTRRPSRMQQHAIEKIFSNFLSNGKTRDAESRISFYVRVYFSHDYRNKLNSPFWAYRINTLHKIAEFKVPGFTNIYSERKISAMSNFEFFLYLIYLSIYDFNKFKNNFLYDRRLSEYENKKVLSRLSDASVLSLLPSFEDMSHTTRYAFLSRVAGVGKNQPIKWLESLFQDEDQETRIRALKSIYSIGLVNDPDKYIQFFTSEIWEERMLVCRLAPYIGETAVLFLEDCSHDKNQQVEKEALNSLKYFEFYERKLSTELRNRQSDFRKVSKNQ